MASFEPFEIPLTIKYDTPTDRSGRIDLYSGPKSIFGFAKVIQLSTHLILNQEVISRSTRAKSADFYMLPSREGSFIQEIIIIVQNYPAESISSTIAVNVLSNHISDALKWLIKSAVGAINEEYKPLEQRLGSDLEPYFDDLQVVLDGPIREAHNFVERLGGTVALLDANGNEMVTFNDDTLDYIKDEHLSDQFEKITGHVTRYNVLTGNGRLKDYRNGNVIPFRPERSFKNHLDLSWSLREVDNGRNGDLRFTVKRVRNARKETKRLKLADCGRTS
jgi:hypothetical protein